MCRALQVRMLRTLSVYTAVPVPSMRSLVVSPSVAYKLEKQWYVFKVE